LLLQRYRQVGLLVLEPLLPRIMAAVVNFEDADEGRVRRSGGRRRWCEVPDVRGGGAWPS
jgi:hypothetical protein